MDNNKQLELGTSKFFNRNAFTISELQQGNSLRYVLPKIYNGLSLLRMIQKRYTSTQLPKHSGKL